MARAGPTGGLQFSLPTRIFIWIIRRSLKPQLALLPSH
jgi:hypothetical protein